MILTCIGLLSTCRLNTINSESFLIRPMQGTSNIKVCWLLLSLPVLCFSSAVHTFQCFRLMFASVPTPLLTSCLTWFSACWSNFMTYDLLISPVNSCSDYLEFLTFYIVSWTFMDFPGGASSKEPACQCRRYSTCVSIPGLVRSPEEGNGKPLHYSCLENPMDSWHATVQRSYRVRHNWSDLACMHVHGLLPRNYPTYTSQVWCFLNLNYSLVYQEEWVTEFVHSKNAIFFSFQKECHI